MTKEKITVVIECEIEKNVDVLAVVKNIEGKVTHYSVEEIKPEKKVGF